MNVWIGGSFDLLHVGHLALFEEADRLAALPGIRPGRMVTVAVNTNEFIARFKNPPVQPLDDRLAMVKAIRWVNQVQINDGQDQPGLILAADTDIILVGDDWAPPRDYPLQLDTDLGWLDKQHIDIRYLPRVGGHSSTRLKATVAGRRVG